MKRATKQRLIRFSLYGILILALLVSIVFGDWGTIGRAFFNLSALLFSLAK